MTTLEINATEEESFVDLPAGDVTLTTSLPVVFWCASADPSIRFRDYRTELKRLHTGSPLKLGAIPEGWKLAVSTRADLLALYTSRPAKPAAVAEPALTAEDIAAKNLQRQIARDMEHADIINTAMDMILARIQQPAAAPYIDLSERAESNDEAPPEIDLSSKMIPDAIGELMEAGETIAAARDRLTPKLNSELSKLKNLRGLAGEDLNREAEIETLLGMLSRLGEG